MKSPPTAGNADQDACDDSGTGTDFDKGDVWTKEKREEIAENENRAVFYLRVLVLLVLVASALTVVVAVYLNMTSQEKSEFEEKFESDSSKIFETLGKTLDQTLGSLDAFVGQISAHAKNTNSQWPFVTLPNFGYHASKLLKLSKGFTCIYVVRVEPEHAAEWLNYSMSPQSLEWVEQGKITQASDEDWTKSTDFENQFFPFFWGPFGPVEEPTPYQNNFMPNWQHYPIIESFAGAPMTVNWDAWQFPGVAHSILAAFEQQKAVISGTANVIVNASDPVQVAQAELGKQWTAQYISPDDEPFEPMTALNYPIFDAQESLQLDPTKKHEARGNFQLSFFFRDLIRDILPEGSRGLITVFTDACGPPFTYRLDGPKQTYLGVGDHHDPKYDYMSKSLTFNEIMDVTKESAAGSSYTGLPLSTTGCSNRSVTIYPSQDMEDDYVTIVPLVATLIALFIFVFTSMVFIFYDCIVSRRQKIVMDRALASGAIVSSLFPEKVRKSMYAEQEQELKKEKSLAAYMHDGDGDFAPIKGKPLADLFHDTTIFFADLAGFTAWSAIRTPVEVFELLETLYGAFDKIALRRKVFKVETIGDCYVAVTGIPEPQKNHATTMVRFARDCMAQMNELTRQLADSLGEDTMNLEMRVGLHTGSTTAGVLRGEKARFQLFGDTVNTASRMESNGVKGRIHVSQSTADALIAAGKKDWLTEREDRIVAKGKGEMVTYFVDITAGTARSLGTMSGQSEDCELEEEDASIGEVLPDRVDMSV